MERRLNVFRDQIGRVRSGWVIATFVAVAVASGLGFSFLIHFPYASSMDSPWVIGSTLPTLVSGLLATVVCRVAFKELTGLEHARPFKQLGLGFGEGALVFVLCVAGPLIAGAMTMRLNDGPTWKFGLLQFVTLAPAAFGEELLLRGLGFQALRRGVGDVAAVIIGGSIFGLLHIMNPGASWLAAALIALVGFWLGAAMIRSRSTWLPIGIHLAWNWLEGFVFGLPVSGTAPGTTFIVSTMTVPTGFWSGGDFGPEAAGFTGIVLLLATVLTLALPRRH